VAEFNNADWLVVALVAVSTVASLWRGFVREAISLAAWVVAFLVATMFGPALETLLAGGIENPQIRQLSAFLLLFVCTLLVCSLLGYLLSQLLKITGLGLVDRILGMAFGLVRGGVVVLALLLLVKLVLERGGSYPAWYQQSVLIPHLLLMENWARDTTASVLNFVVS
jgi:membrane protein required for colicin V production